MCRTLNLIGTLLKSIAIGPYGLRLIHIREALLSAIGHSIAAPAAFFVAVLASHAVQDFDARGIFA
ncbi:MAG: hypothetical protein IT308_03400 [Anaerolineaceae bacterium]|nr:hypothetical protein [Anaerolineaceae bacterium]